MKAVYETSAAEAHQLPPMTLPEFAFIGRSNVGKSTLMNAILNHTGLARTSRQPGRTQMANYFRVNDKWYFVDLPGCGFSATGNKEHKAWQDLMDTYLVRPVIQKFLFLWDPRRDFDKADYQIGLALSERAPLSLILTKCDKISRMERLQRQKFLENAFKSRGIKLDSTHAVSSLKKDGIEQLRDELIGDKEK
jgi:GTP-binding protein